MVHIVSWKGRNLSYIVHRNYGLKINIASLCSFTFDETKEIGRVKIAWFYCPGFESFSCHCNKYIHILICSVCALTSVKTFCPVLQVFNISVSELRSVKKQFLLLSKTDVLTQYYMIFDKLLYNVTHTTYSCKIQFSYL
jgi:hypothetical protein